MAFPGPFAYVPKPAAMEDGDTEPGSASSASGVREGSGEVVAGSGSLAAAHIQPHRGPASAAASSAITHPSAADGNPDGYPPLILAASKGRLAELKLLLKDPAVNVDRLDQGCGMNALIAASLFNKPDVVAHLLAAGAKVNVMSYRYQATALMLAAQNGHIDVVRALVTRENVALDSTIADGLSALSLATAGNHPDVVKGLLEAGAAVNLACGPLRQTALGDAAYGGYVEVVKTLLASPQVAIDATNVYGQSPLHVAARFGKADVAACLLEAGASMTILTADGDTPLQLAIKAKHAAVVEVLLQYGAPMAAVDLVDLEASPSDVAFDVTLADLVADQNSTFATDADPLGLVKPGSLDDPLVIVKGLIKLLGMNEEDQCADYDFFLKSHDLQVRVQAWWHRKGIRAACQLPIVECFAGLNEIWPLFTHDEQVANYDQQSLVCAAALGRLSAITANGKALQHYKAAGISAAGVLRLSAVATRQIEKLIALSEQLLTTMGSAMLEQLMPACLARTGLDNQVDKKTLIADLVRVGWLMPVAQAIVASWESTRAILDAELVPIPEGSTMRQILQRVHEHDNRRAPLFFVQALQRELAAPTLLAALRTWLKLPTIRLPHCTLEMLTHEGIDALFQIQCDQLRQYCEQIASAS